MVLKIQKDIADVIDNFSIKHQQKLKEAVNTIQNLGASVNVFITNKGEWGCFDSEDDMDNMKRAFYLGIFSSAEIKQKFVEYGFEDFDGFGKPLKVNVKQDKKDFDAKELEAEFKKSLRRCADKILEEV